MAKKSIAIGIGVAIALIAAVGIYAISTNSEIIPTETSKIGLEDTAEVALSSEEEQSETPTSPKHSVAVGENLGISSP